jgi:phenylalanyl-tRNA synthetase beta chain
MDLRREVDLIEEVARLVGYDHFDTHLPDPIEPGGLIPGNRRSAACAGPSARWTSGALHPLPGCGRPGGRIPLASPIPCWPTTAICGTTCWMSCSRRPAATCRPTRPGSGVSRSATGVPWGGRAAARNPSCWGGCWPASDARSAGAAAAKGPAPRLLQARGVLQAALETLHLPTRGPSKLVMPRGRICSIPAGRPRC